MSEWTHPPWRWSASFSGPTAAASASTEDRVIIVRKLLRLLAAALAAISAGVLLAGLAPPGAARSGRKRHRFLVGALAAISAGVLLAGLGPSGTAWPATKLVPAGHAKIHKLDVLGEWAHPDDDTKIIGPCGVWHQLYGTRCGIIQITRGEGGGNAVGTERGPALGLRRENEDRAAHYRSGTADIFYLDMVNFYYTQSAPLTQFFWGHDAALERVTRIIRQTEPDIYIGFPPTLDAGGGHGNHQMAGRLIWEGVQDAANPAMFPDQLTGPNALPTWQVKKVFSGGSTAGTGGTTTSANCTTGFVPAPNNLDTVSGVWTGYQSPYKWPAGNLQGQPASTPKTWAQVAAEGTAAYPTQSRTMFQGVAAPNCPRFSLTESFVPFQPNVNANGSPNPLAGQDDAIFFGASKPDPGGLPLGTLLYLTTPNRFDVAASSFPVTVHITPTPVLRSASVALAVPPGWTASVPQRLGDVRTATTATFTVTPAPGAAASQYRIAALLRSGAKSGYTDTVMQIVPPVQGSLQPWGKFAEYDQWATQTAPQALRLGLAPSVQPIGTGETISAPVDVHNWSATQQSGTVSLSVPAGFAADAASKPYGPLAPGAHATVTFRLTNTDPSLASSTSYPLTITTTSGNSARPTSQDVSLDLVPSTAIPKAPAAPTLDGTESPGEYPGPALDLSHVWQGAACQPAGIDCGTAPGTKPGDPDSTYAKVTWNNDDLYFFIHIRDDVQSYAATPQQCFAHWLVDSVEIDIDPRGNSSQTSTTPNIASSVPDTATTFKTGIFPFTNDPTNTLRNPTPNGPCWERDADNHQGYANGPLAKTVPDAPNAPGMQVVSTAQWDGNNDPSKPHPYAGGYYNLEVKIPMTDLPAAVGPTSTPPTGNASSNTIDPEHMGLNILPYNEDNQLHIDQSTRLAWSAWNSVQSDPYHWGHAYLAGYTPPAGQSTTPTKPIIPDTALQGVDSPQTIYQSARNGVPIAGLAPAPASDQIAITRTQLGAKAETVDLTATGPGTAHLFLWTGDQSYIPVYTESCASDPNEPGFTPCSANDGSAPSWGTDMGGHLVRDVTVTVRPGANRVVIPLDAAARQKLAGPGTTLVSFRTAADQVQALAMPTGCDTPPPTNTALPNTVTGLESGQCRGL
ncbi:PIG-L family deacetylase [Streptomyces sp. NPDC046900]|uniref:PIG-L family deacetylase n=1 Tax=Streptomyces sp. NPDC046900 TaxID=3155473 RepID=UPI0033EADBDA